MPPKRTCTLWQDFYEETAVKSTLALFLVFRPALVPRTLSGAWGLRPARFGRQSHASKTHLHALARLPPLSGTQVSVVSLRKRTTAARGLAASRSVVAAVR